MGSVSISRGTGPATSPEGTAVSGSRRRAGRASCVRSACRRPGPLVLGGSVVCTPRPSAFTAATAGSLDAALCGAPRCAGGEAEAVIAGESHLVLLWSLSRFESAPMTELT